MAHQMMIILTDEEYQALRHSAAQAGKPVEALAHDLLTTQIQSAGPGVSNQAFMEHLYRMGLISNLPIRQPLSAEAAAERTRLAKKVGQGQPLSDIVIKERGPRI